MPVAIDPDNLHFFDQETGAAAPLERCSSATLVAAIGVAALAVRAPRRGVARRGAAVGRRPRAALAAAVVPGAGLRAHLLRDARPVRERRRLERPRRPRRGRPLQDGVRPDRQRLVPRRRPEGPDGRCTDPVRGLQRVKDLGFNSIWVTPVVGQQAVQGDSAAYHGYWGLDFTDVDRAPRQRRRLRALHRVRAHARDEGHPRRRRQPHGRRDPRRRRLRRPRRAAVPRLQGQAVQGLALRGRHDVPVPVGREHAEAGDADRHRPDGEEAGLAERRHGLPRPRRHRLLLVQRRVLRAGRLLRPRRPLHRAAARRQRPRAGLRRLDQALRRRRLPGRHGEARGQGVLRRVAAEDPGGRARSGGRRTSRSSARCSSATRRPSPATSGTAASRTCSTSRCRTRSTASRAAPSGARGVAGPALRRRLLQAALGRRTRAGDVPRQPRHGPRGPHDRRPGVRAPRTRSCSSASCSATACSTSSAAHPSSCTETRWG